MSINESQQILPLSNSINLNLGQIQHIKLQQDPSPNPGNYACTAEDQQQQHIRLSQSNQNYLYELQLLLQHQQQQQNQMINSQNSSQKNSNHYQQNNIINNNKEQQYPFIEQSIQNQTPPLMFSGRETPLSQFLSSDMQAQNCYIPQVQLIRPNQQADQDDRFITNSPLQEIQSFYLNQNTNTNVSPIPNQIYNNQYDERYNYEKIQPISLQQQQQDDLLQKLSQLSNSAIRNRNGSNFQEENQIMLQSHSSNQEQLQKQYQQQVQQQYQIHQNQEDEGNSILQRLVREEQFQQKIENMKLTKLQQQQHKLSEDQSQINQKDPFQTQEVYDVGIGSKPFDDIQMLVERENYQNQLIELNEESELLYNEAMQFVNLTKQKDSEMDKEVIRQRKELEDFRRKINEMKSTELTSNNSDGNESILLKKMDLQKLLFKIEDLKLQAQHNSRSQSPKKSPSNISYKQQNKSYYQNPQEKLRKKVQVNTSSSSALLHFMNGKSYLSPKNYLQETEKVLGSSKQERHNVLTPPRYGLKVTKVGGNLRSNTQSMNYLNQSISSISSKTGYRKYPPQSDTKEYYQQEQQSIVADFNQQIKSFQSNDNLVSQKGDNNRKPIQLNQIKTEQHQESTPQKNQFQLNGQKHLNSDIIPNQNAIFIEQQRSLTSNKKNTTTSFFQASPLNGRATNNNINNFSLSPVSVHSNCTLGMGRNDENKGRFQKLENNIFLVQSKTVNSPIVSLLGKDRMIVARPFKGTLQKTGSNRAITDGDIYNFDRINMLVTQVTKALKQEILTRNALDNHYKNIFIIGTKSSQKKAIQLDVLQLLKETFRTKILIMMSNNYSCRIKLRFFENVFENATTVSKLPTSALSHPQSQSQHQDKSYPIQDDIAIDFNPLDQNIEDKIIILDEAIQRIAQLVIDNKKTKIPSSKAGQQQLSSVNANCIRSKVRTLKLSLLVLSNAAIVCKQSYRVSTSNYIIDPERRTPTQIFRDSFHIDSLSQQQQQYPPTFRSFVAGDGSSQAYTPQKQNNQTPSSSIGFKEETVLTDDNLIIFSCAPILKYFEQVRALFKSAHIFEKYSRKINKQQ